RPEHLGRGWGHERAADQRVVGARGIEASATADARRQVRLELVALFSGELVVEICHRKRVDALTQRHREPSRAALREARYFSRSIIRSPSSVVAALPVARGTLLSGRT